MEVIHMKSTYRILNNYIYYILSIFDKVLNGNLA